MTGFSYYIKKARIEKELTVSQVAATLRVTPRTIREWEDFVFPHSKRLVPLLAAALDLSADYLFYLLGWLPPDRRKDMSVAEVEQAMDGFREMN